MNPRIWSLMLCLAITCLLGSCTGVSQPSTSHEVKAFFMAANEANFLGIQDFSAKGANLSAYTQFMGVKYPPTQSVEVLSDPPQRPYQVVAALEGSGSTTAQSKEAIEKFKDKAREIGADAIILHELKGGQGHVALPVSAEFPKKALAIKYRRDL